jgi:hypothetical protein
MLILIFSFVIIWDLGSLKIAYNLNLYFIINSTLFFIPFYKFILSKPNSIFFYQFHILIQIDRPKLRFFCIIYLIQSLICLMSPNQSHSNLAFSFFFHIKFYSSNQFLIIVYKIFKFLNRALQGLTGKAGIYN